MHATDEERSMSQAPSVTDMTKAMKGMKFPADKKALKKHAEDNGAPAGVLSAIDLLPEDEFGSITDVTKAYGQEDKSEISGGDEDESKQQARKGGSKRSSR
jgi:hypothetical protein